MHGKKRALYIHGSRAGIGKTTTTKHIVNQFEDAYSAEVIYKNSANATPNQILHEIHNRVCAEVDGKIPSKTLVQKILNHKLKDGKFILILVLDNFDRMQHVDDLLWDWNDKKIDARARIERFRLMHSTWSDALKVLVTAHVAVATNRPDSHQMIGYSRTTLALRTADPKAKH